MIDRTSPEIVLQGMPQNQILLSDYKVKISLDEFYLNQKKSYIKLYKRTGRSAKEEQLLDMPVNWKKGKAELKDKKSSGSNTGESGDDVYLKDGWYRLKIYAEDLAGNLFCSEPLWSEAYDGCFHAEISETENSTAGTEVKISGVGCQQNAKGRAAMHI